MMKRILPILIALASLANAQYVTNKTFFSGAHLGMTIGECALYYFRGEHPIADGGSTTWGGAPTGQHYVDFRNYGRSNPQHDWRVLVCYRESDGKIVLVDYWNDEKLSKEQMRYLTDLNRPYGPLITRLNNAEEFIVTTPEQDKLEQEAVRPL